MDLFTLRLLTDLAETRSFRKTAERRFISPSAVSQRIQALENEFGQVLVERGKGRPGAQFTEAGVRLLAGARELLARADALEREMRDLSGEVGGKLHVATVYSIGLHALTPAVRAFLTQYPQVNFRLEYLRTDRIYAAVLASDVDCGIVACPREQPQMDVISLHDEPMVVILPPAHRLAPQERIGVRDLNNEAFVAFDPDIPTRQMTDALLRERGVSVEIVHAFDNIETIKRVVEVGQGIAIVPEPTVRREVRDGSLIARPLADADLRRPTGILLRKGRIRSNALVRFLDALTEAASVS